MLEFLCTSPASNFPVEKTQKYKNNEIAFDKSKRRE